MAPWANIWKTEPLRPSTVPVDSPRQTMPMWETEEYPMTYFKSVWARPTKTP